GTYDMGRPMSRLLAACAGFLLGVLLMDLMFDVQALGGPTTLPEPALASIAAYYARVTSGAWPLGAGVGLVMAVAVGGALIQLLRDRESRGRHAPSLALLGVPGSLAFVRVFPNPVRLAMNRDPAPVRADLAHAILRDHLLCLALVAGFLAMQLRGRRQ